MTLSEYALTTVENAVEAIKTYPFLPLGIKFDDPDVVNEITRLINAWSSYVNQATNTVFGVREYVEFYKGTTQPTLVLKHYPIKEIKKFEQVASDGSVVGEIDIATMQLLMGAGDLERGILYIEPSLISRYTTIGIVPELYTQLRTYKITYTSGYVLPKDATAEEPSDVPAALENLVIELVKSQFIAGTDAIRANNLISLTEGNVQRMWADPVEFKLNASQEKILTLFKRKGI